jgi:putative ABC transport system permease protein
MMVVALKGLLGRKVRAVLTSLAIVLGVAMVSGTFILTDTIQHAFNGVFDASYKDTSVVISGKEIVKGSSSGSATVSDSVVAKVRALPDVEAAAGAIVNFGGTTDLVKLIGKDGEALGSGGAPTFGFGFPPDAERFNPMVLVRGTWASGPDQVVIDEGTANDNDYKVGDTIRASGEGPIQRFTVSGIAHLGDLGSIGGATIAVFDLPTAQALLNKQGEVDLISVAGKSGVSNDRLAEEIAPILPDQAQVKTGAEQADSDASDTNKVISIIRLVLLAFGGISLFVGAFVIFNTISITVAQRAREFATLRTLGASRRQVLRSVLIEAGVIGAVAALIGLFLGLALAKGLNAIFVAIGADLPQSGTVFATRTVVVSLLCGILITLVAGFLPAIHATRVPPILAVREGAELPATRFAKYSVYVALALVALSLALIADGLFVATGAFGVLLPLALGTLLLFIAIAMVSNRLIRPLAAFVGQPAERMGGAAGHLARENSIRNPRRTASTAAALMIGLALVTFVATLGKGMYESDKDALNRQVKSDYVLTSGNGFDPFPAGAGDALAKAPGVTLASGVRGDKARIFDTTVDVAGVDTLTINHAYRFDWTSGSDAILTKLFGDGAVVSKDYAKAHKLKVGSPFLLETPKGDRLLMEVHGIYDPPGLDPLFTGIVISQEAFDGAFPRPKDLFTFVDMKDGSSAAGTASLERALAGFPDVKLATKAGWVDERSSGINDLLTGLYVLLALSVIVSLFGMVNTMVLSVFERTRELGMLRAVGMTRRQVRRMVRHESVITALIGASLGLPLGLFLAALVTRGLSDLGVGFHVPVVTLIVFAVVAILAGIVAAIVPARRAARLNVLQALQYE